MLAASPVAMQEWMTVIDAAIQGVPEQAKRRLRTVTNHFSVRRPKSEGALLQGKAGRSASALPTTGSTGSLSASLEESGLNLMESSTFENGAVGASPVVGSVETR